MVVLVLLTLERDSVTAQARATFEHLRQRVEGRVTPRVFVAPPKGLFLIDTAMLRPMRKSETPSVSWLREGCPVGQAQFGNHPHCTAITRAAWRNSQSVIPIRPLSTWAKSAGARRGTIPGKNLIPALRERQATVAKRTDFPVSGLECKSWLLLRLQNGIARCRRSQPLLGIQRRTEQRRGIRCQSALRHVSGIPHHRWRSEPKTRNST